jgi:hypothetical protein
MQNRPRVRCCGWLALIVLSTGAAAGSLTGLSSAASENAPPDEPNARWKIQHFTGAPEQYGGPRAVYFTDEWVTKGNGIEFTNAHTSARMYLSGTISIVEVKR